MIADGSAALLPHRIADAHSVSWHRWWIERDGDRTELSALLAGWDYASHTTVGISVDLDEEALLASTGLDSMDELEILAMADCLLAQQRFVAHQAATRITSVARRQTSRFSSRPAKSRAPSGCPPIWCSHAPRRSGNIGLPSCGDRESILPNPSPCGSKAIPADSPPSLYDSRNWDWETPHGPFSPHTMSFRTVS